MDGRADGNQKKKGFPYKEYFNVKGMPLDLLVNIVKVHPHRSLLDVYPCG